MANGWYAMKRGWLEHECFEPVGKWSRAEAWVWMVETACWKPQTIDIGGKPYTVQRGHLCHSERFLCGKFKWSRTALRTFFAQLEAHKVIEISLAQTGPGAKQKRNQIRLCNYEKYQSAETQREPKENPNRTKEEQVNNIPVGEAVASEPVEVNVLSSAVWNAGKPFLASRGVKSPGPVIGKWLKDNPPMAVLSAIEAAQKCGTQEPVPYISKILNGGGTGQDPDIERWNRIAAQ